MSTLTGIRAVVLHVSGRRVEVAAGQSCSIGRHGTNHVVLADTEASRFHARLDWRDGGPVIADQQSLNGTFVDGVRLSGPVSLQVGQQVRCGATTLRVDLIEEDPLPALLPATDEELTFFEEWRRQERSGRFERQLALHRLLLELEAGERTGTLELRMGGAERAQVVLKQGLIAAVRHEGPGGARTDLAGFEAVLRAGQGSYRFSPAFEPQEGSLDLSARAYLREGPWASTRRHRRED
ncbi:MAG: FHA domain-containing protein [Planctomycetota bacterium]